MIYDEEWKKNITLHKGLIWLMEDLGSITEVLHNLGSSIVLGYLICRTKNL